MSNSVQAFYGNKLRVRACGLLTKEDKLLLVNHLGITQGDFWSPPGGGVAFGESIEACLKREFREEVNLAIEVHELLFVCDFIQLPLHAIELFFRVTSLDSKIETGGDPEAGAPRVIENVKFLTSNEITSKSQNEVHGIFRHLKDPAAITQLRGYFKV